VTIYLACTVRGDRGAVAGLRSLVTVLEASGHTVLTKHLLDDDTDAAEAALTERSVYDRDIRWLETCDILVAEASGSSYGVGFEVGYVLGRASATTQRVILLYRRDRRPQISRLISGNAHPQCVHVEYENPTELPTRVLRALSPES
jgi:nucleoside 2-deoxyribosyltransferase